MIDLDLLFSSSVTPDGQIFPCLDLDLLGFRAIDPDPSDSEIAPALADGQLPLDSEHLREIVRETEPVP